MIQCAVLLFSWSNHSTESTANPRERRHCHVQLTPSKVRHGVWLAKGHTEAGTSAAKASRPISPVSLGFRFPFVDLVWIYLLNQRKCFEQKLHSDGTPGSLAALTLVVLEQYLLTVFISMTLTLFVESNDALASHTFQGPEKC